MPFKMISNISRRRFRQGFKRNISACFLKESERWRERITSNHDGGIFIPMKPAEWSKFVDQIDSSSTKEWIKNQKGLITIPRPLIDEIGGPLLVDSSKISNLMLLREEEDIRTSEDGMLPPSQLWSDLSAAKSDISYEVRAERDNLEDTMISYLLSCYSFDRYKTKVYNKDNPLKLAFPHSDRRPETEILVETIYWVQDLICTPANDLTPGVLQQATKAWAETKSHIVDIEVITGDDLLSYNGMLSTNYGCEMIHAAGRAANQVKDREPRLMRLRYQPYNKSESPPIAIVGKGVTYDTGGLSIKPTTSMLNMKKDMGGAALALGLFRVLVECDFSKPLDCWIPVVENVVDGASFRPGDILRSVNGTTTEIGNTDAEGRLILADALALASAENPDLIIDFATLTGAQRVALGFQIPAFFSNSFENAAAIMRAAKLERDPMWHLPLWEGYRKQIKSKIADFRNVSSSDNGVGGAITAALYLSEFVEDDKNWIHIDFNAFDNSTGLGQAQGLKAMKRFLFDRYRH
mmetsp:Transcript_5171/g.8124  ORF Transcript_5171/g.8124 Transcript_5171/m.8124 type:complete len:522 (-) Transcript_5171:103-1668(-)